MQSTELIEAGFQYAIGNELAENNGAFTNLLFDLGSQRRISRHVALQSK